MRDEQRACPHVRGILNGRVGKIFNCALYTEKIFIAHLIKGIKNKE